MPDRETASYRMITQFLQRWVSRLFEVSALSDDPTDRSRAQGSGDYSGADSCSHRDKAKLHIMAVCSVPQSFILSSGDRVAVERTPKLERKHIPHRLSKGATPSPHEESIAPPGPSLLYGAHCTRILGSHGNPPTNKTNRPLLWDRCQVRDNDHSR